MTSCEKFHRKQVRWLTYLNKNIDYNVNRRDSRLSLIIFLEEENENYIYSNLGSFTVGNHQKHKQKRTSL